VLRRKLANTAKLAIAAVLVELSIGVAAGAVAVFRSSFLDVLVRVAITFTIGGVLPRILSDGCSYTGRIIRTRNSVRMRRWQNGGNTTSGKVWRRGTGRSRRRGQLPVCRLDFSLLSVGEAD
jgi:hypothetical protein